ncbi:MAG: CDP-alcohol phosphatidyltransferase family protein [Paracoccaceae bacterium]
MFDSALQPMQRRLLDNPARKLARLGVRADWITLAAFAAGLAGAGLIAAGAFGWGLVAILANRLLDGLDGAVARATLPTDRGAFADIALDFAFYALVPLAFALADPAANALAAAVLLAGFAGTGSSFLAFAAIAGRRGPASPAKGIHYLGGLTEGAETVAAFVLMCLLPGWFPQIALAFAAACAVTTVSRWWLGWTAFAEAAGPPQDRVSR